MPHGHLHNFCLCIRFRQYRIGFVNIGQVQHFKKPNNTIESYFRHQVDVDLQYIILYYYSTYCKYYVPLGIHIKC